MFDPAETDALLVLVRKEMHRCRRMMRGVSLREWEIKWCRWAVIETKLEFLPKDYQQTETKQMVSYTIKDFQIGDRVSWKRWNIDSNKTVARTGTVTEVGKAKITVHMDDINRPVTVWPRNIANIKRGEEP